jgi:(2Fe-2S) ferredoxin
MRFHCHFFVCTNARPSGGKPSCGSRGSIELHAALVGAVVSRGQLATDVAVTACGCLGPCFEGPTVVVYPAGTWYVGVQAADADELVEAAARGEVVERLRLRSPDED